ncbi:MAG: metalloregulator ArsR/SmtB family transcription factor [Chthonomonadales bacterium]
MNNLVLDQLADPSRRAILQQLRMGPKSVSILVEVTGLKQPNVSNHLARLRDQGIVVAHRSGRVITYHLVDENVEIVLKSASKQPTHLSGDNPALIEAFASRYTSALQTGDEEAASNVIRECISAELPMEDIYIDIMQRSLDEVGHWQANGNITVADEHLATAITDRLMARVSHFYPSKPSTGRRVILGSVAGNWHSIGLRMIADILNHNGWKAQYLGASVPTDAFVKLVRAKKPQVVIISCMVEEHAAETAQLVRQLIEIRNSTGSDLRIGIGGYWINHNLEFVKNCGADFTAPNGKLLMEQLELINYPNPVGE